MLPKTEKQKCANQQGSDDEKDRAYFESVFVSVAEEICRFVEL